MLSSKSLIKPLKSRIANSTLPSFTRFLNPIDSPMFHLAMGWNFSAHVSFCNGLEWLRPCFISQLLVLNGAFHLRSCWCSTGLLFICLMSCWWLDSMFFIFSPVGARRDFCSVPSYLYLALAWSSELFVFRCGLDFRAICISLWLGYPSPSFMVVARLNLYSSIVLLVLVGVQQRFRRYWNPVSLICGTQYSSISFSRFCWSPAEVS